MVMSWTVVLWPVHAWFFLWERIVPALYRVLAVGVAALVTAVVLVGLQVHLLVAVGVSLVLWIGLAIAQEHDERVRLPPDPNFLESLTKAVSTMPPGLEITQANGPHRARRESWDSLVVLTAADEPGHPLAKHYISVQRSAVEGWMDLYVTNDIPGEAESVDDRLRQRGKADLASRITQAQLPPEDAEAIASALTTAYW